MLWNCRSECIQKMRWCLTFCSFLCENPFFLEITFFTVCSEELVFAWPIPLKLSEIINGKTNCFAGKVWSNSYRNFFLAQDLHIITQSSIKKFELKTAWTSGVIYCKPFLTIFVSEAQNMEPIFFFSKKMFYVFHLTQFLILWQINLWNDFFSKSQLVWEQPRISCRFTSSFYHHSSSRNLIHIVLISW